MAKRPNEEEKKEQESQNQEEAKPSSGSSIPVYLEAAARISTSYPLGGQSVDKFDEYSALKMKKAKPVPGYNVLNYVPTLGISKDPTSAVNRAAFQDFNFIRSQISGNRPYEPADHQIYRACVDGMRDLFFYVRRIYGILRKYSATNLYRPTGALEAMGIDAADWFYHAADLYQWLQVHRTALAPFPTVKIGTISTRHNIYNTYLFTDGSIESTQTYIMNQRAFWSYEVVDEVKGMTPRQFPRTYSEFTVMWDEMYSALQNSSDVYIIAADIRRAFGDNIVTELPDTPADYTVEYVELDAIKTSIMNAAIIGTGFDTPESYILEQFRITDKGGYIVCDPEIRMESIARDTIHRICVPLYHVNMVQSNPTAMDILDAVRLKPAINIRDDGAVVVTFDAIGTEVILSAYVVGFDIDGSYLSTQFSTLQYLKYSTNDSYETIFGPVSRMMGDMAAISGALCNFDWHPPVVFNSIDTSAPDDGFTYVFEDIQNYVPMNNNTLKMIHDANLLAEFGI